MYSIAPEGPNNCHTIEYGVVPDTVPPETFIDKLPCVPALQSIGSVDVAFNSTVNSSGSLIVAEPKISSISFPDASKQLPLSFILTL